MFRDWCRETVRSARSKMISALSAGNGRVWPEMRSFGILGPRENQNISASLAPVPLEVHESPGTGVGTVTSCREAEQRCKMMSCVLRHSGDDVILQN